MHASTTLLFFLTWAWLADASAAAAPPSTSPAAASSAAPTSDTLLVTLCSAAYFPGAVQLLASLQEQQADDSIVQLAVLVTPDVNPCMRRLLQTRLNATIIDTAATGWVNRTYGGPRRVTTVHFAKLALLTEPFFRQFRTVVYVDSDMLFREPLQRLVNQTQLADPRAVAFVRVSNPLMTLYREARLPLPESIMHEFPDTPYVFSTRIILLSPQMLESTEEYRQRIEHYLARYGQYFDVNYEQGLLQLLFYRNASSISTSAADAVLTHFYHQNLPWEPGHRQFAEFSKRYARWTGEEGRACWRPSQATRKSNVKA